MTHTNTEGLSDERLAEMLALLKRYRHETPLGHQPHMIAWEVDALIAKCEATAAWNRRAANSAGRVEVKAYLHEPTGNVFSAKDHAILLPKWQRQFAADMTAAEIAADFTPLYTHPSSSVSAEVTERWAKLLAAYDAARENQKDNGPDINLIIIGNYGDLAIQELRAALAALNGGRENG